MHTNIKVFLAIALFALPTVMFGGFSLLRLLVARRLNEFQAAYFRAGHAHAGVLLVLALVVLDLIDRVGASTAVLTLIGVLLVVGVLAQSGGMFLHMVVGRSGRWSAGNTLTTVGALVLTAALVISGIEVVAT
jgi:heme/copper-type cytochrome/quinol oxidase subunit 4